MKLIANVMESMQEPEFVNLTLQRVDTSLSRLEKVIPNIKPEL